MLSHCRHLCFPADFHILRHKLSTWGARTPNHLNGQRKFSIVAAKIRKLNVLSGLKFRTGRVKSEDTWLRVGKKKIREKQRKARKGQTNTQQICRLLTSTRRTFHPKKTHMLRHLRPPSPSPSRAPAPVPSDGKFSVRVFPADTLLQLKHCQTRQWQPKSIARQMKSSARERKTVRTECWGQAPGKVLNNAEQARQKIEILF